MLLTIALLAGQFGLSPPFKPVPPQPALIAAIKHKFDASLIDGASARWRWPLRRNATIYCAWVNSKNRYGGYVGWHPFYVRHRVNQIDEIVLLDAITGDGNAIVSWKACIDNGYNIETPE